MFYQNNTNAKTNNLTNYANYGPFANYAKNGTVVINTADICSEEMWGYYFSSILNVFRDGIETDLIRNNLIDIVFADGVSIRLSAPDLFINIIMWYLNIKIGKTITSDLLFFEENITRESIKRYIDDKFISINRRYIDNKILNTTIDTCLYHIKFIDEFAFYLCNTINLEDFIDLANDNKEFYDAMHSTYENVALSDIKKVGMNHTLKAVDIIKNSKHCLADSLRSGEGVNIKQFREFAINIGVRPDGQGSVFPIPIQNNFLTGGVNNLAAQMIESSNGRTAQILSKMNVSKSGDFARLLGLNNQNSYLHSDPDYICDTHNFEKVIVKNKKVLQMIENRYYRFSPKGQEYFITAKDTQLIGQTIYLRSPMCCASASRGQGICYRCYGDLAFANNLISIGKFAAEQLSSQLTQKLLSAKHILEASVKKLKWILSHNIKFDDVFEVEFNTIKIREDGDFDGWKLLIDRNEIYQEDEFDDFEFNEYVFEIVLQSPQGEQIKFSIESGDNIYITGYLNEMVRAYNGANDIISINLSELTEPIFTVVVFNNELTQTLESITKTINVSKITQSHDKDSILQSLLDLIVESGLTLNSVHAEVILSNQIRDRDDVLELPQWEYPDIPYNLITLNQALNDNLSITTSLLYQKVSKALYNPLSYKKHKPSVTDLFFMEKPQNFINSKDNVVINKIQSDKD